MAYDTADGYVVLFGGGNSSNDSNSLNDTWTYSASGWTQVLPVTAPSAREFASMSYDSADHYILLNGGYYTVPLGHGAYLTGVLTDTWKFSHGTWTLLSPIQSPPACTNGLSTYDAHDGYVLLEQSSCSHAWAFHNGTWTNVTSSSTQSGFGSALAYDTKDGYALFFRGSYGSRTYSYANGTWTLQSRPPVASFKDRDYPCMTYDQKRGAVVLFGGITVQFGKSGASSPVYNDTWRYTGGSWKVVATSTPPPGRFYASMAYDSKLGKLVLFGGVGDNPGLFLGKPAEIFGDTWTIS